MALLAVRLGLYVVPVFLFLAWHGAGQAGETPAKGNAPTITRVATFLSQGGEKLLDTPLALALDAKNHDLIVSSFRSSEIIILDKNGTLVKKMGREAGLDSPYGVAIDGQGRVYVSEVQTGLLKIMSPGGALLSLIDLSKVAGHVVSPGRLTLDKDGLIYVADLRGNEILVLNDQGGLVRSVGKFQYLQKAGMVNGRLLGLSAYGQAVQFFDQQGKVVLGFGAHGDESKKNFSFPTGFAVDARNRLWIADAFQHQLKVFSLDGTHLFNFGRQQQGENGFLFPVDLCFGDNGQLFVLEKGANRIQLFLVGDLDGQAKSTH